jgi:hypothetical protein
VTPGRLPRLKHRLFPFISLLLTPLALITGDSGNDAEIGPGGNCQSHKRAASRGHFGWR